MRADPGHGEPSQRPLDPLRGNLADTLDRRVPQEPGEHPRDVSSVLHGVTPGQELEAVIRDVVRERPMGGLAAHPLTRLHGAVPDLGGLRFQPAPISRVVPLSVVPVP